MSSLSDRFGRWVVFTLTVAFVAWSSLLLYSQDKPSDETPLPEVPFTPLEEQCLRLWSRDIEMYRKFTLDPPELKDEAVAFMRAVQLQELPRPRGRGYEATIEMGDRLMLEGCQDPLVKLYYALAVVQAYGPGFAKNLLIRPLQVWQQSGYPDEAKWLAAYLAVRAKQAEAATLIWEIPDQEILSLVARRVGDPTLESGLERAVFCEFETMLGDFTNRRQFFLESLFQKCLMEKSLNPWLRHMISGLFYMGQGWWARGTGWAYQVSPMGWSMFRENLQKAKEEFLAALQLHPDWYEPAKSMIGIGMTGETGDSAQEWFEKAITLDPTAADACRRYMWALRPRWGGSLEEMYELGLRCAKTQRYDTLVPFQFLHAVSSMEQEVAMTQDEGLPFAMSYVIWRTPGVYEQAIEVLDGMANHPSRSGDIALYPTRSELMSMKVAVACRAQKLEEARRMADELGDRLNMSVFRRFWSQAEGVICETYAFTGKGAQYLWEARDLLETAPSPYSDEVLNKAKELFEKALKADDNKRSQAYCRARLQGLEGLTAFNAGDWYEMRFDEGLTDWIIGAGDWRFEDPTTVRAAGVEPYSPALLRPRYCLPWPLEIEFTIEARPSRFNMMNLGLFIFRPSEKPFSRNADDRCFIRTDADEAVLQIAGRQVMAPCSLRPVNHFKVQLADGRAALWVNGQLAVECRDANFRPGPFYDFGVTSFLWPSSANDWVRLSHVRVRKWNVEKEE